MNLKRIALTAVTAALLAVGVPAAAHADGTVPVFDPNHVNRWECHWVTTGTGPVRICTGEGSGNGWGPVPPRDKMV
ncbi:hypothetical protein ACQKM2_24780 [Streptomyces sp. NPDC004126]|uniref:hypothetical protein n=1 Tax=Streptomyces sp. NPDC004126 TaxID=3390695 RepID=UPI003D032B0C